ncbi:hypothetical protein [Paenibacillus peoriae]|uniref:hypothetical protein n=1 Tax=Paenibacillus peoriae TaxID=59893 RepID=UPI00215A5230|nr:hypothetical protein [Paenibacillus peoriae]
MFSKASASTSSVPALSTRSFIAMDTASLILSAGGFKMTQIFNEFCGSVIDTAPFRDEYFFNQTYS